VRFCSDGELDYVYDIDSPRTIEKITPLGGERKAICRAVELCGTVVLEKRIVKQLFLKRDFPVGQNDPDRERQTERLLELVLFACEKLSELQRDIVPYFYDMLLIFSQTIVIRIIARRAFLLYIWRVIKHSTTLLVSILAAKAPIATTIPSVRNLPGF
jgi:hypothetical protein